jgi:hypothetical protein
MKSYDVRDRGASAHPAGQGKKPWVTPSLEIIALKSAEHGTHPANNDGPGAQLQRPKS